MRKDMKTLRQSANARLRLEKLLTDPCILRRASQQATALVRSGDFRWDEWRDHRQELVLDLICRAPYFNEARGPWGAFVTQVMRNRATILAHHKRGITKREVLFDDLSSDERRPVEDRFVDLNAQPDSRLEVQQAVEQLPTKTKQIVRLLPDHSIREICERSRMSRSQVYRTVRKARAHFIRWGFRGAKRRGSAK